MSMVNGCCVIAHGEEGQDKYLAAYVVPEGNKVFFYLSFQNN